MNITLKILFAVFVSLLAGCAGSGNYSKTYRQLVEPVGEVDAFMLDKGARPRLIISQNYIVLGESDFNAPPEKFDDAVNIGEKLGVTHILVKIEYLYDAQKKAYKFYENYDYVREVQLINGRYYPVYQAIPDPVAVPYYKKFAIYRHKAVYLVKLKAVQ
jgi:hypothetical protein